MNKEKMMKIAKGLSIFAKVIQIIVLVGLIAIGVSGLIVLFTNFDNLNQFAGVESSVEIGNVTIQLAEGVVNTFKLDKTAILLTLLLSFVSAAIIWYQLKIARDILEPMKEGNPFETSVSKKIKLMARVELFGGLILSILPAIINSLISFDSIIMDLFKEGVVKDITVTNSFSLNFIVTAFILYLVSYIFEYGEQLQIESDETL